MNDDLRYPIGPIDRTMELDADARAARVDRIAALPGRLRLRVEGWSADRLDTPYRPDGWTVRQVVHHLADSHVNGYVRLKLALTEESPTVRGYDQPAWGALPDARTADPRISLDLLDAVHARWVLVFRTLTDAEWTRPVVKPGGEATTIGGLASLYAWHGDHHLAHISGLANREGW